MKKRKVSDITEEIIDQKKMKSKKTTHWEFLPWILCYYWNRKSHNFICKLGDPSTQRNYIVKEATMVQKRFFRGAVPCTSRQGWVLFSEVLDFNSRLFFLYNPFTNEVIELPILEKRYREATFSLSVNSSDCIVIAFWIQKQEYLSSKTCRPGDESWKTFRYSGEYIPDSILKLAYAGEFFYCVFSDGKMGAFNIKQQSWKVLSHQLPMRFYDDLTLFDAFNGDLLLSIRHGYGWKFWRFHLLETKWVVVEDEFIKKQVIFRGGHMSLAIPAVGNAKKYAGRMLSIEWFDYGLADEDYRNWGWDKLQKIMIQPPFQRT
ncbi:hypothetical protein EZV62_006905 [Acer yangbiense]|uniref:KIB1-4 beta-propeller domain-containing protein n=1 Tax=Acer yangbiense TaxID=1000413 RepID=A0A5C7I8F5_9ROSI|nr:hypothetical protein EZV62_006905 [Acer yangbiense]